MIFDKYVEWVDDYVKKLGFEIKTADSEIESLIASIEKDKAVEKMIFDKYVEWVDDYVKKLGFEIKTADSEIESLIASIEKDEDVAATVTDEIADIDAEVSRLEGDQKDITAERE